MPFLFYNHLHMENEIQPKVQTETKTTTCLNCGIEFEGNFCPECGQSADTGRFTMRFIFENLLAAFLSRDGGMWFTLRNLFTRPGAMIVEILKGKRRRYFSPFPMLIFALTVYILVFSFTGSRGDFKEIERDLLEVEKSDSIELNLDPGEESVITSSSANHIKRLVGEGFKFYNTYYTAVFMLTLPIFLFVTRVWYGKSNRKRYYRAEYLIAITYSMVMVVLYRCLSSLVYLISHDVSDDMGGFIPIAIIVAFTACFRKMLGFSIVKTVWRSLLALVLYYMILGAIFLAACIALYYIYLKGKMV